MTRRCSYASTFPHSARRRGFTLIEALVATTLALMLMGAVVQMFGSLGDSISDSRSSLEMADSLRTASMRLQKDLAGATATMLPPQRSEDAPGYFEIIEGPIVAPPAASGILVNTIARNSETGDVDNTVGDFDDRLLFTTRSSGQPFEGRSQWGENRMAKSDVAEVAWFVRGNRLYRRQLLVAPGAMPMQGAAAQGFYSNNDISVRLQNGSCLANSLSDLAKRECRFAHDPSVFPFESRAWGLYGLPTLCECSSQNWTAGGPPPFTGAQSAQIDFWKNPFGWGALDVVTGCNTNYNSGSRETEDVMLTNVIGFDVKVWDPAVQRYDDLGWAGENYDPQRAQAPDPRNKQYFSHYGNPMSGLVGSKNAARVYDTWCAEYKAIFGKGTNGLDDDANGVVDDWYDDGASGPVAPPYSAPLRGIQVKIRCFEPDSRLIREITIVQDFLPK